MRNNVKTFLKYSSICFLCIMGIIIWGSFDIFGASWIINQLTSPTFRVEAWFILVMINIFLLSIIFSIGATEDNTQQRHRARI